QRKGQFDSIYGRTTLGILIFQDMIVVPMMLVIPLLPGSLQTVAVSPITILLRGGLMVALVIIGARWAVPRALYQVAKTKDRELFLLSIVAICFAVTYLSYLSGLSLGLGAFLAGLIISESPYSHQAFGNVLPLRDAFSSFFFISIGMLLNLEFVGRNLPEVLALTLGAMILKALIAGLAVLAMGLAFRVSVQVGLALSQIGEFSFILSKAGFESGIISPDVYQLFLDIAVLTMAATSFLMAASPRVADGLLRLPLPEKMRNGHLIHPSDSRLEERDHLIIVGFGVNGRNVAMSARAQGIPYLIVEMDPQIVREESTRGEPIIFGDAATESVLLHVGARSARVMVIAISDAASTRRIVELARRISPGLFIIARTRYLQEMGPLQEIGADVVIPEEYETSVEIFARVLEHYGIPRGEIESFVEKVRSDGYEMFRSLYQEPVCSASITPLSEEIAALQVPASAEGKTVGEIGERGVVTLAVHRDLQT
ncbi:MAG: cation:proton antiporter, partial [Methanothrix sp.]|nr:cation:proton antiporter [Methanothrix sp.]